MISKHYRYLLISAPVLFFIGIAGCSVENKVSNTSGTDTSLWSMKIEKTNESHQGHFVDVDVTINLKSKPIGGFDLLIGYDASVLAFTQAALGDYFVNCDWEYFTYRYNWNGNCGDDCPSGLLRLVGLAETSNGANHPDFDCIEDARDVPLATLSFFVSNDQSIECSFLPVRFYWTECSDNVLSNIRGDTLIFNRRVIDFDGTEIQNHNYQLPGYNGSPTNPCMEVERTELIRYLDFHNGGVDIICGDPALTRGDINTNGISNEIADAVMFTDYYMYGLSAFEDHAEASVAASDVNADGRALTLADMVYLIRIIVGDASPYPPPLPEDPTAEIMVQNGDISIDSPVDLGAAYFVFNVVGDINAPVLQASDMDFKWNREGNELRILVYSFGSEYIPMGQTLVLTVDSSAQLTSVELAGSEGFHTIQAIIHTF